MSAHQAGAGSRVAGWRCGVPYTGTVLRVLPQNPGCGGHRHLVVARDGDTEIETTTDAIDALPDDGGAR